MARKAWLALALVLIGACAKKGALEVPPGGVEDPRVEREWQKDREKE
ncbi:MAG TPA: hypothetical protein VFW37_14675 [Alphaproteobacteria bacterium]|nr:hypothetical protein [Alphaproteobacteria bacterium]